MYHISGNNLSGVAVQFATQLRENATLNYNGVAVFDMYNSTSAHATQLLHNFYRTNYSLYVSLCGDFEFVAVYF